jgi:hypothetical protein
MRRDSKLICIYMNKDTGKSKVQFYLGVIN